VEKGKTQRSAYTMRFVAVGPEDGAVGAPAQMAILEIPDSAPQR